METLILKSDLQPDAQITLYVLGATLLLIISIFLTRAIFSIPKFLRYKKAEIKLLFLLAKSNGVEEKILTDVANELNGDRTVDEIDPKFISELKEL